MYLVSCQLNLAFLGAAATPVDSVKHARNRPLMEDIAAGEVQWSSRSPPLVLVCYVVMI